MDNRYAEMDGRGLWSLVLACLLTLTLVSLGGCAQGSDTNGAVGAASGESEQTAESSEEGNEEVVEIDVPDECLDRKGTLTAYAVAELDGADLLALLAQQGYTWSERNELWASENGSAALMVLDKDNKPLEEEAVAKLGVGADEKTVSYRLVSGNYSTAKRAYEGLAGRVMENEDVEYADTSAVGIVSGPSGKRCLVFVSTSNGVHVAQVFSEGAVEAGLFAKAAGLDDATSLDAAFEKLTGRLPGSQK